MVPDSGKEDGLDSREEKARGIKRREFLARGMAAALGACVLSGKARAVESGFLPFPESILPVRPFGNTGANVTLLTFGGGGPWADVVTSRWCGVYGSARRRAFGGSHPERGEARWDT